MIVLFSFINILESVAQRTDEPVNEIKAIARYADAKVVLRWAPTSPSAWLKLNKFGYTIERFTISRNGILLETPERKELTSSIILPDPVETWEAEVNQNDYAAILAQALYGEGFVVEEMQGGLAKIINKAKEVDQRFSFALFAADLNFEAARKAALGYVDTSVVPNEEYLYRINSKVPEDILKIKTGLVSVKTTTTDPLPSPIDLFAVPQDKSVMLTWEYDLFKTIFTSYYIERSEDGSNFKRLNEVPLVNLNDKPDAPAKRMFYVDTIASNTKKYTYRVQGVSPFGELSPYSEIVSALGIKKLEEVPHIDRHVFDKSGNVLLKWSFKKEAESQLQSFEINWSAQEKGPYKRIKEGIAPTTRETLIVEPEPSNYYSVTAVGKNNQRTTSFIAYVQTIDSIPPAKPVGLKAVVDTLGIVNLEWSANQEKDLLGYRVFRGNLAKEELAQITVSPILTTSYMDTLQVKSLNRKVFYQVVAVDERYNMSEFSEEFELKKPDVVPPSAPIFTKYKVVQEGIELQWINSSSDDVTAHLLYRQELTQQEKGWLPIFKTDTVSKFIDTKVSAGIQYRYAIFAKDEAGLQSVPSTPITVSKQVSSNAEIIKGFTVIADRTNYKIDLSWKKLPGTVTEILIYKSKKKEKPVIFKQMPNTINKLVDTEVSPGNMYVYQIKVITSQGNHSQLVTKEVNY